VGSAPWVDDELRSLIGVTVDAPHSWQGSHARFRIEAPLGEGGTGVAFFALRMADDGDTPHVVKVFRPTLLLKAPEIAETSRRKEGAAMRRLNERVPPSPYIVRMTEAGDLPVTFKDQPLSLPWIASEYINGGPEGTTLTERITRSVEATGVGFDPERILRVLRCVTEGLNAIHEVGLIHRDIKPDNVLLCGFAETEIAKITDFGVAKAQGFEVTFGPQPVGTIGYAAPEQLGLLQADTTLATDVFALGVLVYRMIAADEYFRRIQFAQLAIRKDDGPDPRPALRDAPRLHPELKKAQTNVDALDAAIRKATSVRPERRFPTARAFYSAIEPLLRGLIKSETARGRRSATRERLRTIMLEAAGRTTWTTRHKPGGDRVLRAIAWEPDGRLLGVARDGLAYWDGQSWFNVPAPQSVPAGNLHFALRVGAGRFLLGGVGGILLELTETGWQEVAPLSDPNLVFERAAGTPDELLVITATHFGTPTLYVSDSRSWRSTLAIPNAASINGVGQLDETRWIVVGRSTAGTAYLAVYDSSRHTITQMPSPAPRPLLAVATDVEGIAYAVGPGGLAISIRGEGAEIRVEAEESSTQRDLSAVAIDPAGVAWATAQGRVMKRFMLGGVAPKWEAVHSYDWLVPTIGLLAAGGGVFAVTVDGAILEGREEKVKIGSLTPPSRTV